MKNNKKITLLKKQQLVALEKCILTTTTNLQVKTNLRAGISRGLLCGGSPNGCVDDPDGFTTDSTIDNRLNRIQNYI